MTSQEIDLVRRAIELLRRLLPDDQARVGGPAPPRCPVARFVQEYLAPDPDADLTCAELWKFFQEIAQAGELSPLRKAAFLRQLPAIMENVFHVRKCHHILRSGHRQRGFKGINLRLDGCPASVPEVTPES
jgi:hypothetical protein